MIIKLKKLSLLLLIVVLFLSVATLRIINERNDKNWTLAFYFAGDNNLENEMVKNLKNIAKYYENYKNVNVVVFFDRDNDISRDNIFTTWMGARVFNVNKSYREILREPFVAPFLGDPWGVETMSTSAETMNQFFQFVKNNFTSRRYAFFVTGHGNGWVYGEERFLQKDHPFSKEYYLDMDSINIRKGLENIHADLVVLDICLMGDLETVNLLSDVTDYLVVHQTNIPAAGMDYDDLMKRFLRNKNMSPGSLAYDVVESYRHTHNESFFHFATTAIEFNKHYFKFIEEFSSMVLNPENYEKIKDIADRSTRVNAWTDVSPEMIDMELLGEELGLSKYFNKTSKGFIANSFFRNTSLTGLSIFYPKTNHVQMLEDYDKLGALPFWNEFLKKKETE